MKPFKAKNEVLAQRKQDEIFKKMSADKKVELWASFWKLAKDLVGDKINYGTDRSKAASPSSRTNS